MRKCVLCLSVLIVFAWSVVAVAASSECVDNAHHVLEPVAHSSTCVGTHCVSRFVYFSAQLSVTSLVPNTGPTSGSSNVLVKGTAIREFGSLMSCSFGDVIVPAKIMYDDQESSISLVCASPPLASISKAFVTNGTTSGNSTGYGVVVEISLTGESYTTSGFVFFYYDDVNPKLVTPSNVSSAGGDFISVNTSMLPWQPNATFNPFCKFTAKQNNLVQGTFESIVVAWIDHSNIAITCTTPSFGFVGNISVSVTINGQDYSKIAINLLVQDYWYIPNMSGTVPYAREYHIASYIPEPQRMAVFGGLNGYFNNDIHVLHFNVFDTFQVSVDKQLVWLDMSSNETTRGSRPSARGQHASAVVGEVVFVYGGSTNFMDAPSDEMYLLRPDTYWNSTSSVLGSAKMLFALGMCCNTTTTSSSSATVCTFANATKNCTTSDSWFDTYRMCAKQGMGMCTRDALSSGVCSRLLASCNATSTWAKSQLSDAWVFEKVIAASSNAPISRALHTMNVLNGSQIVLFGGRSKVDCQSISYCAVPQGDVWLYSTDSRKWVESTVSGTSPTNRSAHASAVTVDVNGKSFLWVFGGESLSPTIYIGNLPYPGGLQLVNDLYRLDLGSMNWTCIHSSNSSSSKLPKPRMSHSLTALGVNHLVLFGGSGSSGAGWLNDLWIFSLDSLSWTQYSLSRAPSARYGHTATLLQGSRIMILGGSGIYGSVLKEVHILDTSGKGSLVTCPIGSAGVGLCQWCRDGWTYAASSGMTACATCSTCSHSISSVCRPWQDTQCGS